VLILIPVYQDQFTVKYAIDASVSARLPQLLLKLAHKTIFNLLFLQIALHHDGVQTYIHVLPDSADFRLVPN
jgi:hypothetical protein